MASQETESDKMEIHWKDQDGRMAMVWAKSIRPRRPTFERILTFRGAVTAPMAVVRRKSTLGLAVLALLVGVFIACVTGLLGEGVDRSPEARNRLQLIHEVIDQRARLR